MLNPASLPWVSVPSTALPQDEYVISSFSTHWIKYAKPSLWYLLFLTLGIGLYTFALQFTQQEPMFYLLWFVGSGLCIAAHHCFFHTMLSEGLVDIIITNRRLLYLEDKLLLRNDMHEVTLQNILAVEAHKHGLVENLLQYGELWFDTGGTSLESGRVIPRVPHPGHKATMITGVLPTGS